MLLSMRVTERILYILDEYYMHIDLNSKKTSLPRLATGVYQHRQLLRLMYLQ